MKSNSYLLELLLFIFPIIINTSFSARLPPIPSAYKQIIGKEVKSQTFHYAIDKAIDKINGLPPSQRTEEIQDLHLIKQYLYDFGYLQQPGSGDVLDTKTISAINNYQKKFNLEVTSDLDNETLQQMSLPRCGVPDMNFEYRLTHTDNASWPKGTAWFPEGTKNLILTYGFAPESEIQLDTANVFRNAFTRWSTTTGIVMFTETSLYDYANIKIGFYGNSNDGVEDVVMADTFISLQFNSNVKSGVMQLDASKYWVLPTYNNTWSWQNAEFDLETVVMHQIGHLLGLDHSFDEESIMYPAILPSQQRKVQITVSDNQAIQNLYTNAATEARANYGYVVSSLDLLTSLSLGLAFVAMLILN